MSHELPAAGYGFIWPQLGFASDGESIRVSCRQSSALSQEPIHYLSEFDVAVPARVFETGIDSFMDLVLRRLDILGETDLHLLWREVLAERADRDKLSIWFGGIRVAHKGERDAAYDEAAVSAAMKKPEITLKVALGLGRGRDRVLTCDLTKEYVAINGDYRS